LNPLWIDITWSAGGRSSELTVELCQHVQAFSGVDVVMHLTITNMEIEMIDTALETAKKNGI
jgi:methylenetetrahydrofolate reductase (NADPH)